jgi:hypothetical protein
VGSSDDINVLDGNRKDRRMRRKCMEKEIYEQGNRQDDEGNLQ